MASLATNRFKQLALTGGVDLENDTVRVLLVDDTFTEDADHDFVSDVSADELSGTGYSRQTLSNPTVTEDDANDKAYFDADDVTFTGINAGTMAYAIIYRQVGGDDTSPGDDEVLFEIDIANVSTNGSDVTIQWDSAGIIELT